MKKLTTIAALRNYLETNYRQEIVNGIPRYLFRGENKFYPQTKSSIGRMAETEPDCVGYAQRIYLSIHHDMYLIDGYSIGGTKEATTLLQHYGMPTPQIDLSGNFDIAIYFATENRSLGAETAYLRGEQLPNLFVIDTTLMPDELEIINHNFLTTKDLKAASKNRYFRQDGYAITTKDNHTKTVILNFDLKSKAYANFVHPVSFVPSDPENIPFDREYIYASLDFLPPKIQSILKKMAQEFYLADNPFPQYILGLIDKIHP